MFRGYIYIVKNYVNDKVYIGQTTTTIEKRWSQHKTGMNRIKLKYIHFYRALRKYGVEQFYIEEITHVDCATKKELIKTLNRLEKLYIKQYNSFENGYNSTAGGGGLLHVKPSEVTRKKLSDAKKGIIPTQEHIKKTALKHRGLKMTAETKEKLYNAQKRQILQYTQDGVLVKEWDCIRSAANAFGLKSTSQIRNVLNGKLHTTQGFVWKYKDGTVRYKKLRRPVIQLSVEDKYICEYTSAAEAARDLCIRDDGIIACCKNRRITSGGYKWKYKEEYGT